MQQFYCPYFYAYRQMQGPPTTPPPSFTPKPTSTSSSQPGLMAVDPGAIKPCVYTFVYLWLKNGQSFWAYLVYVGKTSASGWKYQGGRWVYFGVDLKEIKSFTCY